MYVTRFALPAILKKQHAHIINIASVAGTRGIPKQSIYCASKHGVVAFGDVLAQELKDRGIKVVSICPGAIRTPLWNSETNPYPGDISRIMEPEEIVDLVDFILKQPEHTLYKKIILFPTNEWH
jgi:3-oxoacyl-[acyl-carrier protein] reductase